ncbi:thioredoxin-like protein, partial [Gorgonomyces haynaldii]
VGDEIPSLVLSNERGEEVNLLDEAKESGLVIFFYPKANTPGCTKQACEFRDKTDDFTEKGYKIFGCSADSQKSLTNWKTKYDFKYDLLSDPQFELIGPLGIKKAPKSVIRSHVVIGKGGVIEDLKIQISPLESPKQALEFI